MVKISGKKIDPKDIPTTSAVSSYEEFVRVFMASSDKGNEINIPENVKAWSVYSSLARVRKKLDLVGKLGIRVVDCNRVFIYKL